MTLLAQEHDFARPWAKRRVQIYAWGSAFSVIVAVGSIIGVGVGLIPMVPLTGTIACFLFMTPVFVMFVTSWIDVPGETRTTLEKANEFTMLWCVIAGAASELWWEVAWLIGDLLGLMHITDQQRWGWVFWYYGINDVRYLKSDGPLWAMELAVVIGAAKLLVSWWKLRKAGNDTEQRIRPLWWSFFTMSTMLVVFFIYRRRSTSRLSQLSAPLFLGRIDRPDLRELAVVDRPARQPAVRCNAIGLSLRKEGFVFGLG